jgi:HEAT repeat protein
MAQRTVKALAATLLLRFEHQESLSFLRDLASSEVVANRMQAAEALGAFPTAPGTALLMHLLQDDNIKVKVQAITSLGQSKATTALPFLSPLVTDAVAETNVHMQIAALEALGQLATDDSLRVLRLAVDNPGLAIPARMAALSALGHSQAESAVESLLKAAASADTFMRLAAYKLLGELHTRQALPLLRQHLTQLKV